MGSNSLTQAELQDIFHYDTEGYLVWKKAPRRGVRALSRAGYERKDGYWIIALKRHGSPKLLHRLIFLYHHGWCPDLIDHKDKDHTNNRIENLRPSDKTFNAHNSDYVFGSTPYRGVSWSKHLNKFVAYFKHKNKRTYLGSFNTAEEAYTVYSAKKKEVVG